MRCAARPVKAIAPATKIPFARRRLKAKRWGGRITGSEKSVLSGGVRRIGDSPVKRQSPAAARSTRLCGGGAAGCVIRGGIGGLRPVLRTRVARFLPRSLTARENKVAEREGFE